MKKRILIIGGILVAAGAIGAGVWYYLQGSDTSSGGEVVYVSTVSSLTDSASGVDDRFAGVVEPQKTVEVKIDSGRKVKEVKVKTGEEVKQGQLLFEYDLSSIQEDLQEAKLALDRLKNEALSLSDQIATLTAEKKKATADNQLSYTIEIETNKMNLKKNEYDQKSKEAQIQKLQNATSNTEVRSEIDGVIQKIDTSKMSNEDGDSLDESMGEDLMMGGSGEQTSDAFITILSTGAYRIKGKVNELKTDTIIQGEPVIIRSRVDENQTWRGTMGAIDRENASSENNNNSMYFGMMETGDSQTTSSSYPFYVELDSSDGLMLGQHVYIERDNGQEDKKAGLWLSDFFIVDADSEEPYVWAADDKDKLEKRSITLGQYDEVLGEYEIVDGLTTKDCIAFPAEGLTEGSRTAVGDGSQSPAAADPGAIDMQPNEDEPDLIEEPFDESDMPQDFSDEELMPMDGAPDMGFAEDVEAVG